MFLKFGRHPRLMMTEEPTGGGGGGGEGLPGGNEPNLGGGDPSLGSLPPTTQEWDALPKSWTKDLEPHYKSAPEPVRQFIHRREADVERGISTYRQAAETYQRLHGVFKDAPPDLDVPGVLEALAHNHLLLANATDPAQKQAIFAQLAQHYGIEFAQQSAQGSGADGLTPKQRAEIQALLNPIQQFAQQQTEAQLRAQTEAAGRAVDAFFSDPKNKYVNEVGPAMAEIVKSGRTKDLGVAYEMAVLQNPVTRAKYLADLQTAASAPSGAGGSGGRNVNSSSAGAPPASGKTMDDTMKSIVDKAYAKS